MTGRCCVPLKLLGKHDVVAAESSAALYVVRTGAVESDGGRVVNLTVFLVVAGPLLRMDLIVSWLELSSVL